MQNDLEKLLKQCDIAVSARWVCAMYRMKYQHGIVAVMPNEYQNTLRFYEDTYKKEAAELDRMKREFLNKYQKPVKTFTYIRDYETNVETER